LTETISDEKIVITAEPKQPFEERIADQKTVVYATLIDPAVIKIAAENLKCKVFAKYGFLKTKPEEVSIVSIGKYYKPYIVVSGKYTVDYYRKHISTIRVADDVSEVLIGIDRLKPKQINSSYGQVHRGIELPSQEHVKKEAKASLVLDSAGQPISLDELPLSPSESDPEEVLARSGKKELPREFGLSILRTQIFKRPTDASWIDNELFEVNEYVVIYVPIFKVLFRKVQTGKEKTLKFNGLTGKLIHK
jgi:hypothetical protein